MAKVHWRSCILAALFIHGGALVPQAAGSDEEVPPLRHKERMRGVFISLMDTMIAPVPYFSSIPINRPFTAIGLAVRGRSSPDAEVLAEYARRAMQFVWRNLAYRSRSQSFSLLMPVHQVFRQSTFRTAIC